MKKYALFTLLLILLTSLTGCAEQTYEQPENSIRHGISGGAFGITLEVGADMPNSIEYESEPLSQELREYIVKNVPGYENNRYLVQLEADTGIRWIDFKKGNTVVYYPPFDETYTHIGSILNSPDGRYIALNLTKGFMNPWSKLLIIDTKKHTFAEPLTDEVLLTPPDGAQCTEVTVVEKRTEENKHNECVSEGPLSMYMIDYWSTDHTVELIKSFPSSTIIYSLDIQ